MNSKNKNMTNLQDLEMELWFRMRNEGTITWKTKNGVIIPVKDMTDEHLINTIRMLRNKENEIQYLDVIEDPRLC